MDASLELELSSGKTVGEGRGVSQPGLGPTQYASPITRAPVQFVTEGSDGLTWRNRSDVIDS